MRITDLYLEKYCTVPVLQCELLISSMKNIVRFQYFNANY